MADSVWAWVRTVRTWVRTPTVGRSCAGPSRIGIWPGRTPFPSAGRLPSCRVGNHGHDYSEFRRRWEPPLARPSMQSFANPRNPPQALPILITARYPRFPRP
ncbi:hypothetical protein C2I33_20240 [Ralstonia solanacearum]|nr:hypothetical protein C2I33_20240 [Ralstonia solanacearum]